MEKSLYQNTMFKMILNIFNIILPILTGPYIMRKLTQDQVGSLNFAQSIFGYFFMFASFGVYQYGIREISRVKKEKEKVEKVFTSLFLITTITNMGACLIYYIVINMTLSDSTIYNICNLFTLYFYFNIFQIEWINEALENFDFIAIKSIIVKIIYVIGIFIFVKSSNDFGAYIFLIIFNTALGNILSYIYIKRRLKFNFKKIEIIKHITPMFIMVVLSNANVLYTQLDRLMIGGTLGEEILSYYVIAQGIMIIINTLSLSIIQACAPRINAYVAEGKKEKYVLLLNKISRIYFMFVFPVSIGMGLLAEDLMILYGGEQYAGRGTILLLFAIYMVSVGFENIIGNQILYTNRREKTQVKILFVGGIINVLLNSLLLIFNIFSLNSVMVTTIIANVIIIVLENNYVKQNLDIDYKIFSIERWRYCFGALIFIPIIVVITMLGITGVLKIVISVTICGLAYLIFLIMSKDEILYEIKGKIIEKVKKQ